MKIHVWVLPYDNITPSKKFPPYLDVAFPFIRLYGDHTKLICVPSQKVAYYFKAVGGIATMLGVSSGHDCLQTLDEFYLRLSLKDATARKGRGGLHWQVNNKLMWVVKPLPLTAEARKELDLLIAKAI